MVVPMICRCGEVFEPSRKGQHCAPRHNKCRSSSWRAEGNNTHTQRRGATEFIGIDGENAKTYCRRCDCQRFQSDTKCCACRHHYDDHAFPYVLLFCGADSIEDPQGLGWEEVFSFLYGHFQQGRRQAFVTFFGTYDFGQWIKGISEQKAHKLLRPDHRKNGYGNWSVDLKGVNGWWEVAIMPDTRFSIRPACGCRDAKATWSQKGKKSCKPVCTHKGREWMHIGDVGPFFQASFLKTIDPAEWVGEAPCSFAEYNKISEGKSRRADAQLDHAMRAYCGLEVTVLARLMGLVERGLEELGVRLGPSQWYGPGPIAAAWLSARGHVYNRSRVREMRDHDDNLDEVFCAAYASYFGPWFEMPAHGNIPALYEYDLASAFPAEVAMLPCVVHATWEPTKTFDPTDTALLYCRMKGRDAHLGVHLHRHDGVRVCRPHETTGWIWSHELAASQRAGLVDEIEVLDGWRMAAPCPDVAQPLAEVNELYQLRLRATKGSPLGRAIKLVLNSIYGKLCQQVGSSPWQNMVWASLVTAGVRVQILDAIAAHPLRSAGVYMIASDAVYFSEPHPDLPTDKVDEPLLGSWEPELQKDVCLYKPGVWWSGEATKTRGFKRGDLESRKAAAERAYDGLAERLRDAGEPLELGQRDWPRLRLPVAFAVTGWKVALLRNKWASCGETETRTLHELTAWPAKRGDLVLSDQGMAGSFASPVGARSGLAWWDPVAEVIRTGVPAGGGKSTPFNAVRVHNADVLDTLGETPDGGAKLLIREGLGL